MNEKKKSLPKIKLSKNDQKGKKVEKSWILKESVEKTWKLKEKVEESWKLKESWEKLNTE